MTWHTETAPRALLAVVTGLAAFVGLSLLRIKLQYVLHPNAFFGLLLTMLMYLIPGALVGLLARQPKLPHAAVLGGLTVAVVWLEIPLQRAALSGGQVVQFLALISLFGVAITVAGCFVGQWMMQLARSKDPWSRRNS